MVGPTAWFVLEALAAEAKAIGSQVDVECNTRGLAEIVGLSKDTVARAMRRLAAAGIVARVDRRNYRTGQFASTTYVVDLAAAGVRVDTVPDSAAAARCDTATTATARQVEPDDATVQLSLLS
jgi:DNA-binding IclR family transcriptional regulator